jgi:hypothetical protein
LDEYLYLEQILLDFKRKIKPFVRRKLKTGFFKVFEYSMKLGEFQIKVGKSEDLINKLNTRIFLHQIKRSYLQKVGSLFHVNSKKLNEKKIRHLRFLLEKKIFKRHRQENLQVFKTIYRFNQSLRKSQFLKQNSPDILDYLKTRFLSEYKTGELGFLDKIIKTPSAESNQVFVNSLFSGRFRNRFKKSSRGKKRVSVRSIMAQRQRKIFTDYEQGFKCGLENVLSAILIVLVKQSLTRKMLKDSFQEVKEQNKLMKQRDIKNKMVIMQKCINISNLVQSKTLIWKAQWFRNFESLAKSRIFMKKKPSEPSQFIEVNDKFMRSSGVRRRVRTIGSVGFAIKARGRNGTRFTKSRSLAKKPNNAAVPKDISRMYQVYMGRVLKKLDSFFVRKFRKTRKSSMYAVKCYTRKFWARKRVSVLTPEEKQGKLARLFLLMRCKVAELQSGMLYHLYKKFVLLPPFGNIVCRNLVKITKWKLHLSLEKLIKHKKEIINQEYKSKYGIECLSRIFLNLKSNVFGKFRDLCK